MSPPPPRVLILQPCDEDGPAFLGAWLQRAGVPFEVCRVESGDVVPVSAEPWDAIAMLGGTMSVNDDLPFLARAEALMRDAIMRDRPVIGHCLGGQMLARALGARTADHPEPEIGWGRIEPTAHALAAAWLGTSAALPVYQWHHQSFALPVGAVRLARSAACANQAFAYGPHLGMQFHVEVDAEKLSRWHREAPAEGAALLHHAGVQDEATMRRDSRRLLADSQRLAARIYTRWLSLGDGAG
ncbi:MAG: type 1 glutamine amidotransferase [Betaproteobacteria bacterium]